MLLIKYKILLIDHTIKRIDIIKQNIQSDVKIIIIEKDNYISLISKIEELKLEKIVSIGIIKEEEHNDTYNLFNVDEKPILKDVYLRDPKLYSWYEFIKTINYIKSTYELEDLDFISCNLASNNDYTFVFNKLEKILNIKVNGSSKTVGNGNWELDRGNKNLIGNYFNEFINSYPYIFGINYNLSVSTISGIINQTPNVYLNIISNPVMTPNVNNYWTMINTLSGDLTISGSVNNYFIGILVTF